MAYSVLDILCIIRWISRTHLWVKWGTCVKTTDKEKTVLSPALSFLRHTTDAEFVPWFHFKSLSGLYDKTLNQVIHFSKILCQNVCRKHTLANESSFNLKEILHGMIIISLINSLWKLANKNIYDISLYKILYITCPFIVWLLITIPTKIKKKPTNGSST